MPSALDDLIAVVEFLMRTKTASGPVAEALDRLKVRAAAAEAKAAITELSDGKEG